MGKKSEAYVYRRNPARFAVAEATTVEWKTVDNCSVRWGWQKANSCKTLCKKVPYIKDADKSPNLVATGHHIETQVGRNSWKTLIIQTTPVCPDNCKPGLGMKLEKVHASRRNASDIKEKKCRSLT